MAYSERRSESGPIFERTEGVEYAQSWLGSARQLISR
jgi:hypothetical protein